MMHEVGIAINVLETVQATSRTHKKRKVIDVYLQVGQLRAIEPEVMRFCWNVVSKGTVAEGSQLHIDFVPAKGYCEVCRCVFGASDLIFVCPKCGGHKVKTHQGNELLLERVVMADLEADAVKVVV